MFGGLCFLHRGHLSCGLVGDVLMVRVGAHAYPAALRRPHVREMDFTGRPLRGLIYVDPPGLRTAAALAPCHQREYLEWITEAKRPETRARRIATALEWLAEGRRRNWKYERQRGSQAPVGENTTGA